MTANHAQTPTKGDLKKAWDWYRANQDKQSGIEQNFRTYRLEFLRAWDAIIAAAEQRGAIKALRDYASPLNELHILIWDDGEVPSWQAMELATKIKIDILNRADRITDQMERDDD